MIRNTSKAKTAAKAVQYWLHINRTHEVDYDAVREFIKAEGLLDIRPITEDEQIDALLRRVVRNETWKTPRGRRVRKYGVPRQMHDGELIALPPEDMRYAKPDHVRWIFDANYEGGIRSLKRVAIELDEWNDYNQFNQKLPDYNWDLRDLVDEARFKEYDDSFNADELNDDDED